MATRNVTFIPDVILEDIFKCLTYGENDKHREIGKQWKRVVEGGQNILPLFKFKGYIHVYNGYRVVQDGLVPWDDIGIELDAVFPNLNLCVFQRVTITSFKKCLPVFMV